MNSDIVWRPSVFLSSSLDANFKVSQAHLLNIDGNFYLMTHMWESNNTNYNEECLRIHFKIYRLILSLKSNTNIRLMHPIEINIVTKPGYHLSNSFQDMCKKLFWHSFFDADPWSEMPVQHHTLPSYRKRRESFELFLRKAWKTHFMLLSHFCYKTYSNFYFSKNVHHHFLSSIHMHFSPKTEKSFARFYKKCGNRRMDGRTNGEGSVNRIFLRSMTGAKPSPVP